MLQNIYQPDAFFERVKFVGRTLDVPKHMIMASFKGRLHDFTIFCRVMWRMSVKRPELRRYFWRTLFDCVRAQSRRVQIGDCADDLLLAPHRLHEFPSKSLGRHGGLIGGVFRNAGPRFRGHDN